MRIVIFTPWFYPNFGGVETVTDLLATGLGAQHSVTILTHFPSEQSERPRPYAVLRRAPWKRQFEIVRGADVVLMFSASLRFIWIPLLLRKPVFVNHYTWLPWRKRPLICAVQRLACLLVKNVAPSRVVAETYGRGTRVMPNPFDERVFLAAPREAREGDLVFLGRLVDEKGVDILLRALAVLREEGLRPNLTVIGDGPEASALHELAAELRVGEQVRWAGPKRDQDLARELSRHRVMVVPSRWREPFGIVAVEGLASGCRLVVPDDGGLVEAAGETAFTFSRGQPASMASAIRRAFDAPFDAQERAAVARHIEQYAVPAVVERYASLFASAVKAT